MTTTDVSIVEKIKKLLALADGNQNHHEREVAMQFAMDLLSKHNLTMSEVQSTLLNLSTCEIEGNFRPEPWIRAVLKAACTLYYTDIYISERFDHNWRKIGVPIFVGTTENIAVTMEVGTWLLNSIRRESNRVYKDTYERRSFRLGAADTILSRAIEMIKTEGCQHNATGTSLVVMRNQFVRANQEHFARLKLRPTRNRRTYLDEDAYNDGEVFGKQVRLHKEHLALSNSN